MTRAEDTAHRLRADAESGLLATTCASVGVELLVLFGSARRTPELAEDVDLAYSIGPDGQGDDLAVANALGERYGDALDLMPLHRAGVVARFEALARGDLLFERTAGTFARRQMAAMGEYFDAQPLRDLALRVLAG